MFIKLMVLKCCSKNIIVGKKPTYEAIVKESFK